MRRASIHEQYDVGTGGRLGSASRTGDYGTSGTSGTGGTGRVRQVGQVGRGAWDKWEQKKLPLVRQLNSLLYTNYLIIHHLHQSSLKTL